MSNNLILGISFGLSILLFIVAVIAGLWLHKAELRPNKTSPFRRILTAFRLFLVLFFVAAMCAVYPINHFDLAARDVDVLKAFFASLINTFRLFFMAGDYIAACKIIGSCTELSTSLSTTYLIYLACIYFVSPVFTLGFILSLFRDISSTVRYVFSHRSDLYLFSELNERALALAEDIAEKNHGKRRPLIVFTDVFSHGEEHTEELIADAKQLGALCMKKDITEAGSYLKKNRSQKLYFIGKNEDENIRQALTLINHHADSKVDTKKLEFYVFSNTVESETLLSSVYSVEECNDKKRIPKAMKIRRINENRNLALQEMLNHPIFDGADERDGIKHIKIAIVGLGGYGTELLKATCWCGQMPGYALTLHIFEKKRENGEAKIRAIAPELIKYNHNQEQFEAQYNIEFHYCDVGCADFIDEIKRIEGLTQVYVSLGDDEKNIEVAMRIRAALGEMAQGNRKQIPPIYPIVYSAAKSETVWPSSELKYMSMGTGIFLIGGLRNRYTLYNIEQPDLESEAQALHQIHKSGEADITLFNQYEYYRNLSIAKAVYQRLRTEKCALKEMAGDSPEAKRNNDILLEFEHRCWKTYMRADGYVYAPIGTSDKVSKLHPDLVPFDKLPKAKKT